MYNLISCICHNPIQHEIKVKSEIKQCCLVSSLLFNILLGCIMGGLFIGSLNSLLKIFIISSGSSVILGKFHQNSLLKLSNLRCKSINTKFIWHWYSYVYPIITLRVLIKTLTTLIWWKIFKQNLTYQKPRLISWTSEAANFCTFSNSLLFVSKYRTIRPILFLVLFWKRNVLPPLQVQKSETSIFQIL